MSSFDDFNTVDDYHFNSPFNWLCTNCNNATNPILASPDFNHPTYLECDTLPQTVLDLFGEPTTPLSPLTSGSSTLVGVDSGSSWNDQSTLSTGFWPLGTAQYTPTYEDLDPGTATASDAMSVSSVNTTALQAIPPTSPPPINVRKKSTTARRRQYWCNECPRVFDRICNLKNHKLTHDPNHPRPYKCPIRRCPKAFSRKHDLHRHLATLKHRNDILALKALTNHDGITA